MKDSAELVEITNDTEDPARLRERARAARKAEMRLAEETRTAAVIAISPRCARNAPVKCRDVLAFHDPCSKCPCPGFVSKADPPK